jgi:hypothetical protein
VGILDRLNRVNLRDGEWIDVRPFTVEEAEIIDKKAGKLKTEDGGLDYAARTYFFMKTARAQIVAWSDPADCTPENTDKLPSDVNHLVWDCLTSGESDELPLPTGSPSTDTSTE